MQILHSNQKQKGVTVVFLVSQEDCHMILMAEKITTDSLVTKTAEVYFLIVTFSLD